MGTTEKSGADIAAEAAANVRRDFRTGVGLAVVAARAGEEQPPGTVFMNLAIGEVPHAQAVSLPGDRDRFRDYAVINVLNFLRKTLTDT